MRGIRTEAKDLAQSTSEFAESGSMLANEFGLQVFDEAEVEENIGHQLERQLGVDPASVLAKVRSQRPLEFDPDVAMLERMVRMTRQEIARLPNRASTPEQMRIRDTLTLKLKLLYDLLPVREASPAPAPMMPAAVVTAPIAAQSKPSQPPPPSKQSAKKERVELTCPICKTQFQGLTKPTTKTYNTHLSACLGGDGDSEEEEEEEGEGSDVEEGSGRRKTPLVVVKDDFDPVAYEQRMRAYKRRMRAWIDTYNDQAQDTRAAELAFKQVEDCGEEEQENGADDDEDEEEEPLCQVVPGLNAPLRLYTRLLPHQKEALEWLFRHFERQTGCILGDEMGLGKSCQAISILASLKVSGKLPNPVLIVAPLTTISQWVEELHNWYAPFKVVCLHESFGKGRAARVGKIAKQAFAPGETHADVCLITYQGLQKSANELVKLEWSFAILDEAHLIKNPDAQITQTCKRLNSVHRVALTGSPIQNRLHELWSLFDFVAPRKLGTLPTFEFCFVEPIRLGGLYGATNAQILAAFEQAKALRQCVTPHMLRRTKKEVATWLPEKTERVLFCTLTTTQRNMYEDYLASDYVQSLTSAATTRGGGGGRKEDGGKAWRAIATLRKICNHPDLLERAPSGGEEEEDLRDFDYEKSSKMQVLNAILAEWRQHGDKVLVFCQGTKMLSVIEAFARDRGYPTLRMDGSTAPRQRQGLIQRFNTGPVSSTFLFLLTTRVGGIGINLTGANKVVIFDPDWNPSTDSQARERAWRLGQTRPVTVYRLIVSGTIEEKIYHRQIFKQFLTNKVLDNPSQRRFFKESDLRDLFTLTDHQGRRTTDTSQSFYHEQEQRQKQDEDEGEKPDHAMLQRLFQSEESFHQAFPQNVVEEASRSESDRVVREKLARDKARAARKRFFAQEQAEFGRDQLPVSVPTYTGRNGPAPAAHALLERLKSGGSATAAATAASTMGNAQQEAAQVRDAAARRVAVFKQVQTLLRSKPGFSATSAELLQIGKAMLGNEPDGEAVFREILRQIATLNPADRKWKLQAKFR